ncbi:MAG TPA: hypothetical protein VE177_07050 [Candidatus Binatus sp.]|nr:hypothetical protein [Candidatus Binatus sp.]
MSTAAVETNSSAVNPPVVDDGIVILPDSVSENFGKTEKGRVEGTSISREDLSPKTSSRKPGRPRRRSTPDRNLGVTDDPLDGNPLTGTTLE